MLKPANALAAGHTRDSTPRGMSPPGHGEERGEGEKRRGDLVRARECDSGSGAAINSIWMMGDGGVSEARNPDVSLVCTCTAQGSLLEVAVRPAEWPSSGPAWLPGCPVRLRTALHSLQMAWRPASVGIQEQIYPETHSDDAPLLVSQPSISVLGKGVGTRLSI
jgi:hypothetical protein